MAIANEQYNIVAARRVATNGLLWQSPALSLTAQAFLFTIALDSGTVVGARLIAAFLALVASLVSMQLMAKNRYFEVRDSKILEDYEKAKQEDSFQIIHGRPDYSKADCYQKCKSYHLWLLMLAAFGIAAFVVIVGLLASHEWIVGSAI